jgi:hypothetical protein
MPPKSSESDKPILKSSISKAIGSSPLLPGESKSDYEQGLSSVIEELGAKTATQIYLAEKIFECLWWIRRYENQKRMTIVNQMVDLLRPSYALGTWAEESAIAKALDNNQSNLELESFLQYKSWTMEILTQKAMARSMTSIASIDRQIELYAKLLSRFQASFELHFHRKLNTERMILQNEILKRDLSAIEHEPIKALPSHDEQSSSEDR